MKNLSQSLKTELTKIVEIWCQENNYCRLAVILDAKIQKLEW